MNRCIVYDIYSIFARDSSLLKHEAYKGEESTIIFWLYSLWLEHSDPLSIWKNSKNQLHLPNEVILRIGPFLFFRSQEYSVLRNRLKQHSSILIISLLFLTSVINLMAKIRLIKLYFSSSAFSTLDHPFLYEYPSFDLIIFASSCFERSILNSKFILSLIILRVIGGFRGRNIALLDWIMSHRN